MYLNTAFHREDAVNDDEEQLFQLPFADCDQVWHEIQPIRPPLPHTDPRRGRGPKRHRLAQAQLAGQVIDEEKPAARRFNRNLQIRTKRQNEEDTGIAQPELPTPRASGQLQQATNLRQDQDARV